MDTELAQTYFNDEGFIAFLRTQKFDIGIGGSQLSDGLLFKHIGLKYVKLEPEDVEGHSLRFKLDLPVMITPFPSSDTFANYEYDDLPALNS